MGTLWIPSYRLVAGHYVPDPNGPQVALLTLDPVEDWPIPAEIGCAHCGALAPRCRVESDSPTVTSSLYHCPACAGDTVRYHADGRVWRTVRTAEPCPEEPC